MRSYKNRENITSLMRIARRRAGLTQKELAKKMRTRQPSIARAEKGGWSSINFAERYFKECGGRLRFNHVSYMFKDGSYSSFTEQH